MPFQECMNARLGDPTAFPSKPTFFLVPSETGKTGVTPLSLFHHRLEPAIPSRRGLPPVENPGRAETTKIQVKPRQKEK